MIFQKRDQDFKFIVKKVKCNIHDSSNESNIDLHFKDYLHIKPNLSKILHLNFSKNYISYT